MDMPQHKKECPNRPGRSMTRLTTTTDCIETYDDGPTTASLDRRQNAAPSKDLLERLQRDFQKLSTRLANYELASTSNAPTWKEQDLDKLKYQTQVVLEWKKAVDFRLDALKQAVAVLEKCKSEGEYQWMSCQQKLMVAEQLQMDINLARDTFLKEQNYNRQANLEFAKNLDEFKELFEHESDRVGELWNEQKRAADEIQRDVAQLKQSMDEHKTKNVSVVFDIKTISQIASETAEKLEIQEREFAKFAQQVDQLRLDLEILENLASADCRTATPGHLVWKISSFDDKMAKSKESNAVLKSPIFYTHDYGYKIRILVYLNGLKKWKDRYALVSIHVLKSDHDALLKWPCHIEGSVTLRDQENVENVSLSCFLTLLMVVLQPKNFSKHIVAKRQTGDEENEEPQESSFSYIFIPHGTLTKGCFLKNDEIFLEIRIEQNRRLLTETTL
ncbi:TNF receptor-associated factor 3 isoform X3 [Tenebrio molitor]